MVGLLFQLLFVPVGAFIFQPSMMLEFFFFSLLSLVAIFFFCREKGILLPLYEVLLLIFLMYISLVLFSGQKSLISHIVPYQYDQLFSRIDHFIHFGQYPHELLRLTEWPPFFLWLIDKMYLAWFFVIYVWMMAVLVFQNDSPQKQTEIISFCLVWIVIGNFAAIMSSSVGPIFWEVYYSDIPNPYTPLMDHLHEVNENVNIYAVGFRDLLLELENNDRVIDYNAPSAMPSVHVAMTFLVFLSTPARFKILKWMAFLFMLMTMVGSVVLAWHYAIDGYVGILLTWIIYKLTKMSVKLYHDRRRLSLDTDI